MRGAISAAVAQQLYTLLVGGSNPSSPTIFMKVTLTIILATLLFQGCATAPLHLAAAKGDLATVQKLLDDGAKVDQTDNLGRTALYFAAEKGSNKVVALLLAKGANPTHRSLLSPGNTPFHIAAQNGHNDIIGMFLAANIAPDLRNRSLQTPLMLAAWARLPETVNLLLSHGADPALQDNTGWSALHADWNPKPSDADYEDVMEMLVSHKGPVNLAATNPEGFTPLMSACRVGSTYVVKLLLQAGAQINVRDINDESPYGIAAAAHNQPVMDLLTAGGAITRPNFYGDEAPHKPVPIKLPTE